MGVSFTTRVSSPYDLGTVQIKRGACAMGSGKVCIRVSLLLHV